MNNEELAKEIHMEIHSVRRIQNYKPSIMERNVSRFIIERFREECKECREVGEQLKNVPKKKGFFERIKEVKID